MRNLLKNNALRLALVSCIFAIPAYVLYRISFEDTSMIQDGLVAFIVAQVGCKLYS